MSDAELIATIETHLAETAFRGQGFPKIGASRRFAGIRVHKEKLLWFRRSDPFEDRRRGRQTCKDDSTRGWIRQRHGYRPPAQERDELTGFAVARGSRAGAGRAGASRPRGGARRPLRS